MATIKFFTFSDMLEESKATVLCHQVNCMGVMGSGIAKSIKERFPEVYTAYLQSYKTGNLKLGDCQVIRLSESKHNAWYVVNLAGQYNYGREPGKRYTSYDGLYNALEKLSKFCIMHSEVTSVAFPYKFGCDRGGANWKIVLTMIEEAFKGFNGTIEIHSLNDIN